MKQLTLVPIGGLSNRIYAITSAIAFCKDYDVKLRIIWFKDKGMGADFHSLFDLSTEVDKSKVEIIDAKWYHYIYDRPRKRNLWLPWIYQFFLFDKRSYEKDIETFNVNSIIDLLKHEKNVYLVHYGCFCVQRKMDALIINDEIEVRINQIINLFPQYDKAIGIHIRRTDNVISIKKSPLHLFIQAIDKELEKNSSVFFYVASDSMEEKLLLKKKYGDIIFMSKDESKRSDPEGIKDALIELYVLSKTKRIYGSMYSSFSVLAAELSNIPLCVLSVDNE